jgi:hypothetical protein
MLLRIVNFLADDEEIHRGAVVREDEQMVTVRCLEPDRLDLTCSGGDLSFERSWQRFARNSGRLEETGEFFDTDSLNPQSVSAITGYVLTYEMLSGMQPGMVTLLQELVALGRQANHLDPHNNCAVSYLEHRRPCGFRPDLEASELLKAAAGPCGYEMPLNGSTCRLYGRFDGDSLRLRIRDEYPHINYRSFVPAANELIRQHGFAHN